ncbi:hypothetical protein PLCT1_01662 [Planctomycetaceae bacterium]|nr:hypothetical protein PLCT1_01662 [Planctomycetaceae bacterium]
MRALLVTVSILLSALLVSGTDFTQADSSTDTAPKTKIAASALRQDMRKLWSDHVIWTRSYIVAAVGNQPDNKAASVRLLKNQEDIGAAIVPFYGKEAGDQLTVLLKDHITIAVALINAAKSGDKAAYAEADKRWQANGEEISDFLSKANSNWSKAALVDMMKMHLSSTTKEVTSRLEKKWEDDVAAFDEAYAHILKMADALSDGIIKQFPDRFTGE